MNIDINDPNNYEHKSINLCYVKECLDPAEYWIMGDAFGLCDMHFEMLEKKEIRLK